MTSRWKQRYWSVDAPGLDAAGAADLVEHARALSTVVGATAVDPDLWLTQHLDQDTVLTLVRALSLASEADGVEPEERWEIRQLADDFRGWLDSTKSSSAED